VLSLGDKNGAPSIRARSLPLIKRLNHLWRRERPIEFRAEPAARGAAIRADGEIVIEVLPGDVVSGDARSTAAQWATTLNRRMQARPGAAR